MVRPAQREVAHLPADDDPAATGHGHASAVREPANVAWRGAARPAPAVSRLQRVVGPPSAIVVIDVMTRSSSGCRREGLFDISGEHAIGRKFRDLDISYRWKACARGSRSEVRPHPVQDRARHVHPEYGETVHGS